MLAASLTVTAVHCILFLDQGFSTNWMTLKEAQENQLGCADKPDYFTTVATVLLVRSENSLYKACLTAECNKKVS
jgi:replication factor A1